MTITNNNKNITINIILLIKTIVYHIKIYHISLNFVAQPKNQTKITATYVPLLIVIF